MSAFFAHLIKLSCIFLLLIVLLTGCIKTSSILNKTSNNQPAITATGTPVGNPVAKTIGADGGSLNSIDGKFSVIIPAGALSKDVYMSIQTLTNQSPGGIGFAYDLQPNGTQFSVPATLIYHYSAGEVNGSFSNFLYIVTQDSTGAWSFDPSGSSVDTTIMIVSTSTPHFSTYALMSDLIMNFGQKEFHKNESNFVSINEFAPYLQNGRMLLSASTQVPDQNVNNWNLNDQGKTTPYGSILGAGGYVTFQAPATIDQEQLVKVSAEVTGPFISYENGKKVTVNAVTLADRIVLLPGNQHTSDSLAFDVFAYVHLTGTSGRYLDDYYDSAHIEVDIIHRVVTIPADSIQNFAPNVTNPTWRSMDKKTTVRWIADQTGVINITGGFGFEDGSDSVGIQFESQGTITPKWEITDHGVTSIFGNDPVAGWPGAAVFAVKDSTQIIYEQDDGHNHFLLKVTPKH